MKNPVPRSKSKAEINIAGIKIRSGLPRNCSKKINNMKAIQTITKLAVYRTQMGYRHFSTSVSSAFSTQVNSRRLAWVPADQSPSVGLVHSSASKPIAHKTRTSHFNSVMTRKSALAIDAQMTNGSGSGIHRPRRFPALTGEKPGAAHTDGRLSHRRDPVV